MVKGIRPPGVINKSRDRILVFLFYPTPNIKGISDTCFYTSELSFNSRILNSIADNLVTDEQSTREWLKQNPLTLKFTTAGNGSLYLMLNNENFFVRSIDENGQEKYTFAHILDVPTICSIADYLSQWSIASVLCDIIGSSRRRQSQGGYGNNQYQPNNYPKQQQFPQQQFPQQQYQGVPQQSFPNQQTTQPYTNGQPQTTQFPTQVDNFPKPDEIG